MERLNVKIIFETVCSYLKFIFFSSNIYEEIIAVNLSIK
jgi:hypothetical protein